jgi:hypothetical protein
MGTENLNEKIYCATETKEIVTGQGAETTGQEDKSQLRRRVESRMSEMEAALGQLATDAAHESRARDITTALEGAKGSISGGWDHVGEMEAAQLAHWLESTKFLVVQAAKPAPVPAPSAPAERSEAVLSV